MSESPPLTQCWIWNGVEFNLRDSIPLTDRGFRYGMSVFESMRVLDGHVSFLTEHLASISYAARRKEFRFPEESLERVGHVLSRVRGSAFARVYVTAGDGPPQAPATECRVALICESRDRVLPEAYRVTVDPCEHSVRQENLKTGNYWPNITALTRALHQGANEALLLNSKGRVMGCAMANAFFKIGGEWCTPPPGDGARCGVTRRWVSSQIRVIERSLSLEETRSASEAFLTNSWIGIMPVAALEGRILETGAEILDLKTRLEQFSGARGAEPSKSARSEP